MENKGLSVFVIFIVSLASVFLSSNLFSSFELDAQYEFQGRVVAITNDGVEIETDGTTQEVSLSDGQKGQLYVLETVAISEGEVFQVDDSSVGYYENMQIVTSEGVVQNVDSEGVTINDTTYSCDDNTIDCAPGDNVYFEFYEDNDGVETIINMYEQEKLFDLRVETISRNSDGCMVLNNEYVIDASTDLNIDIMTIAVMDNCQISVDEKNNIDILRYVA